ncbi:MAG TPA: hypothetical protein VK498_07605 [Ferruginibacter sp.]|nr:hypothetical protein [Ferruginibacter sp.]
MKKLNLILLFSLFLVSCQSNSAKGQMLVGKIDNSVAVITANKTTLLTNFSNNLLRLSGITGNFTDATIVQDGSNYYLVFTGTQFKSSLLLKLMPSSDNTTLVYEDDGGGGGHVTCTTSECAAEPRGCVPAPVGLACTPCANGGKCTKTVSSASMLQ